MSTPEMITELGSSVAPTDIDSWFRGFMGRDILIYFGRLQSHKKCIKHKNLCVLPAPRLAPKSENNSESPASAHEPASRARSETEGVVTKPDINRLGEDQARAASLMRDFGAIFQEMLDIFDNM